MRTPCRTGDAAVTVTPGSARLSGSVTRPVMVPVGLPWAKAALADGRQSTRQDQFRTRNMTAPLTVRALARQARSPGVSDYTAARQAQRCRNVSQARRRRVASRTGHGDADRRRRAAVPGVTSRRHADPVTPLPVGWTA